MSTDGTSVRESLLSELLSDDTFRPAEPRTIVETGLTATALEEMVCKYLLVIGSASGRDIAGHLCLPFAILEELLRALRIAAGAGAGRVGTDRRLRLPA